MNSVITCDSVSIMHMLLFVAFFAILRTVYLQSLSQPVLAIVLSPAVNFAKMNKKIINEKKYRKGARKDS